MAAQAVLPYDTLVKQLSYWHSQDSTRPAFVFADRCRKKSVLSYGQLYELGGRWAAVLHGDGVRRQALVANTLPNSPERVLCEVGIVMAGAVSVNAHCQLADGSDLLFTLRQSEAYAVCVNPDEDRGPWSVLKQHVQLDPLNNTVTSGSLPALKKVYFIRRASHHNPIFSQESEGTDIQSDDTKPHSRVRKDENHQHTSTAASTAEEFHDDFIKGLQASNVFYVAEVLPDEVMTVFNTSGSTGFSKLVPATHTRFLTLCSLFFRGTTELTMTINCSPMGWTGGYVFLYFAYGQGRVLLDMWNGPPRDMAACVWDMVVTEKCSDGTLQPYLVHQISKLEDRKAWKMKSIVLTGQPITKEAVSEALMISESVIITYASTELMSITVKVLTESTDYEDHQVGHTLPFNTVKVCDADGKEVTKGTKGEIYAKTPYMAMEYLNNKEATNMSFTQDGLLRTGDVGVILEDGSLLVEGRHHDAIHRGNYIFYPAWLESRILNCCPGLQEVMVVGVPHRSLGQEICACFVASDPTVNEEHVRSQVEKDILAGEEDPLSPLPRFYLSFQDFPRTFSGKPLRKDVRQQAATRLSLG